MLKRVLKYWNKPNHAAYLFVAPAFLVLLLFSLLPLIVSFFISTLDVTTYFSNIKFIGIDNFVEAFHDRRFIRSFRTTGLFILFDVPVGMLFAMLVAALVSGTGFRDKFCRTVYILPIICSSTVVAIMWKLFLNPNVGWGVYFLERLGFPKLAIFSNRDLAIYGIIFISIWRGFGITCIILVAAMQGVAEELYDAAILDGAGRWDQFWSITVPGISSTLWFLFITRVVGSFQVFDLIYTITNGGPNHSTETVVSYIYSVAFNTDNRLGYATAMSEILFVIILAVSVVMYGKMIKQEKEGGNGK